MGKKQIRYDLISMLSQDRKHPSPRVKKTVDTLAETTFRKYIELRAIIRRTKRKALRWISEESPGYKLQKKELAEQRKKTEKVRNLLLEAQIENSNLEEKVREYEGLKSILKATSQNLTKANTRISGLQEQVVEQGESIRQLSSDLLETTRKYKRTTLDAIVTLSSYFLESPQFQKTKCLVIINHAGENEIPIYSKNSSDLYEKTLSLRNQGEKKYNAEVEGIGNVTILPQRISQDLLVTTIYHSNEEKTRKMIKRILRFGRVMKNIIGKKDSSPEPIRYGSLINPALSTN